MRVILIIILGIFVAWLITTCTDNIGRYEDRLKAYVGDTIIIQKDTLVVTSYDVWSDELILNDGIKIKESFVRGKDNNGEE